MSKKKASEPQVHVHYVYHIYMPPGAPAPAPGYFMTKATAPGQMPPDYIMTAPGYYPQESADVPEPGAKQ